MAKLEIMMRAIPLTHLCKQFYKTLDVTYPSNFTVRNDLEVNSKDIVIPGTKFIDFLQLRVKKLCHELMYRC